MQIDQGISQGNDSGASEGAGTQRSLRDLLGSTKQDASHRAPETEGRIDGGTVNPARKPYVWSEERKARARARAEARRAGDDKETILEVKAAPERAAPAAKPTKEDVDGWAGLIYLGHALVAGMLKMPELQLDKAVSMELSAASMNVMRHYSSAILSEKSQDWIKLAMVAGSIYVPRFGAARERVAAVKRSRMKPPDAGFPRPPSPPEVETVPQFNNKDHGTDDEAL